MKWLLLRPAHALRVGAVACLLAAAPSVAKADQIDRVLVNDSGEIASKLAALKPKNIAVLPLQVQIGNQPATFKQGVEGLQMANKLQNLLVLTNPTGQPGEYVVLTDAAKKAAEAGKKAGKAIDWTTPAGRKALLDLQLPVAWDDKAQHAPDTYLTGTLMVSANLKEASIVLKTFSRANPELKPLCTLKDEDANGNVIGIRVDRNTLADLGRSFAVPKKVLLAKHKGGLAGRTKAVVEPDEAASESAAGGMTTSDTPPLAAGGAIVMNNCPVELTVRYNGVTAAATADGTSNFKMTQTPPPGSRIDFQLVNTSDKAVAVVLTIDGKNLIQLNPDERADRNGNREKWRMFVLEPKSTVPLYKVEGWLKDASGKFEAIKVDTEESSATRFATMAPQTAGKIELTVYPANDGVLPPITDPGTGGSGSTPPAGSSPTTDPDPAVGQDQATDAAALESVDKAMGRTRTAAAAKQLVLSKLPKGTTTAATTKGGLKIAMPATKAVKGKTKGLAADGGGEVIDGDAVVEKGFIHSALPTASMVITYYTPEMAGAAPAGGSN